jgi:hypothetical protein
MPPTSQSRSTPESESRWHSQPDSGPRNLSVGRLRMSVERDETVDVLLQAREAYERRDWVLALDRLRGAGDLAAEDSMALATSAYLLGNVDEAVPMPLS